MELLALGSNAECRTIIMEKKFKNFKEVLHGMKFFPKTGTKPLIPQKKQLKSEPKPKHKKTPCLRCGCLHPGTEKTCFRTKNAKNEIISTPLSSEAKEARDRMLKKKED